MEKEHREQSERSEWSEERLRELLPTASLLLRLRAKVLRRRFDRTRKGKGSEGFSLFEAALVLLILSIVITVWLPSRLRMVQVSSAERFASEVNWALEAARRYYWSDLGHRNFPTDWDSLVRNGFLPAAPRDPFGGTVTISANNTASPKWMEIDVAGGLAEKTAAGAFMARVPFASLDTSVSPPVIRIRMTEAMIFPVKDEEIMFTGVVPDGTVIARRDCPVRGEWEAYVVPVDYLSSDGYPVLGVRAWYENVNATNYRVRCEVRTLLGTGNDCYVAVYEICP